jgi:hypothetical protein
MSDQYRCFLPRLIEGDVLPEDIDDAIDEWHASDHACELHEYLGFTSEEYAAFLHDPGTLEVIAHARREGRSLEELLHLYAANDDGRVMLAARDVKPAAAAALLHWLEARRANRA